MHCSQALPDVFLKDGVGGAALMQSSVSLFINITFRGTECGYLLGHSTIANGQDRQNPAN